VAVSRLTGSEYDETFKARLVDHITRFSLHGLKGNHHGEIG
jgi:hypothetical protein